MCQIEMGNKTVEIELHSSWKQRLQQELQSERMRRLKEYLKSEYQQGQTVYPPPQETFAALNMAPFEKVKVVIVGQDPYHGAGQAHGLCFSVREGVPFPPSLRNIFKELSSDLGVAIPSSGSLVKWAEQGVLMLNAVLTVRESQAASHEGLGWEEFTDKIIHLLNEEKENLVFVLWGSYAQKKASFVDRNKHFVIESPHPSPLSAYRGFFGTRPFSRVNSYLKTKGIQEVDWSLS